MSVGRVRRIGRTRGLRQNLMLLGGAAVVLGIAVPVILMTVQRLAVKRTRVAHPAPGRVVSVQGYGTHLNCLGEADTGSPTIVLEADHGDFTLDWVGVHVRLAERYRVCAYDRAGYAWSDPRPGPRDAAHVGDELRLALRAAEETSPIVLVGHGLGGVYARYYAASWPDEVAGLVLVDPLTDYVHSDAYQQSQRGFLSSYEMTRFFVGSGLRRALAPILRDRALPPAARVLTSDLQAAYSAFLSDLTTYDTAVAELSAAANSVDQASAARGEPPALGTLPLVVLTASQTSPPGRGPDAAPTLPADESVVKLQGELARHSSVGERRMLGRSGHLVQLDEPEAIISAVDDVYAAATVGASLR